MKIPEHLENVKSASLNKSRYFSPFDKVVLDGRFPNNEFWERLFELPLDEHRQVLTSSNFHVVDFDPEKCSESSLSSNGSCGRITTTRKNCRLPATEEHDSKVYRISPRTVYFYLEFGCLRQTKTMCGNRSCINPYHQVPESVFERDSENVAPNVTYSGQRQTFNNFVRGMSVSEAINMVFDAGHTEDGISAMPIQDFIEVAMAHREYTTRLKREVSKEQVIIVAGR